MNLLTEKQKKVIFSIGTVFLIIFVCEFIASFIYNPKNFKPLIPVGFDDRFVVLCYPTDPENIFPVDLNKSDDQKVFSSKMADFYFFDPVIENDYLTKAKKKKGYSQISYLADESPHCMIFDTAPDSRRRLITPNKFTSSIAIIGDSFAFGQGVKDSETFTNFLSEDLHSQVVVFANMGANLERIFEQFNEVLIWSDKYHFSKIIYLFVLNDPFISKELDDKQTNINDLMNYRPQNISLGGNIFLKTSVWLSNHSKVYGFFSEKIISYLTSKKTVAWYRNIFSEETNPELTKSFDIISLMNQRAKARGITFNLVIYPLMANMNNYPFTEAHTKIVELAKQRGIATIDLLPAFKKHSDKKLTVHSVDYHPNGAAHKIAASETASRLKLEK